MEKPSVDSQYLPSLEETQSSKTGIKKDAECINDDNVEESKTNKSMTQSEISLQKLIQTIGKRCS